MPAPERFVFVRDGFHFSAFLFTPFWLLAYRLWLTLAAYVIVIGVIMASMAEMEAPDWAKALASLLIALLIGFEASTLRRWTLMRRGWRTLGFVVGDDRENAERRFFAEWVHRGEIAPPTPPSSQYALPARRGPSSDNDVIGLFPQPESPQ